MINKKHRKVSKILNYIGHLHIYSITFTYYILASIVTGYVSISILVFLVGILIGTASSAIKIKISIIIPEIKKYKSVIKKKKKKHDKTVFLAKTKLNTVEALTSKALINSNISHEEFFQ